MCRAALCQPVRIEEQAPADPVQPPGIAALPAVIAGALPGAQKAFLRQLVANPGSGQPSQKMTQPPLVPGDQTGKGRLVAPRSASGELGFVGVIQKLRS